MDWLEKIGLYSIPAFLLLIAVEHVAYYLARKEKAPQRRSTSMSPKDTAASLATYGIGYFAAPLGRFIDVPFLAIAASLTPFALGGSAWWLLLLALPLTDLAYYAEHRLSHRVRLFWAAHSVHHSSEHFNLSTALRLSWLIPGQVVQSLVYVPLVLIGMPFVDRVPQPDHRAALSISAAYRAHRSAAALRRVPVQHAVTPPVHRGADNLCLRQEYGGILIWTELRQLRGDRAGPLRTHQEHRPQ